MPEPLQVEGKTRPKHDDSWPAQSRAQAREASGLRISLPPVDAGLHLIEYLWEVGPGVDSGMGVLPLGWLDLQAWQATTGIALSAWEVLTLRRLSRAYLLEADAAKKLDCPAPWLDERTREDRKAIDGHVRNLFRR